MNQKIIDLQVKELSKSQYTKEHVLSELEHVMEHVPVKKEIVYQRTNKIDKAFKKLYIAYCQLLQEDGRDVICYDKVVKPHHLLKKQGETDYILYPERLFHYIKGGLPKSSRQKLKDKYDKFVSEIDINNLSDYQKGYYECLQSLMVAFNFLRGNEVYKESKN